MIHTAVDEPASLQDAGTEPRVEPISDPRLIPEIWPEVLPFVQAALDEAAGERSATDYLALLCQQQMQLWLVFMGKDLAAVVVTEIVNYPRQRVCNGMLLSGDGMKDWLAPAEEVIRGWARELGCQAITITGRFGWERVFGKLGYRKQYITLRKSLVS